jgi:hypothetical protein
MGMDKRTVRRVPLDIYLNKFLDGVPYLARSKDISLEGIYLTRLIEPRFRGRRVGLQFQLPGTNEVVYAEGEIMRDADKIAAHGLGIRFTLLTERHRKLIERYISTHRDSAPKAA